MWGNEACKLPRAAPQSHRFSSSGAPGSEEGYCSLGGDGSSLALMEPQWSLIDSPDALDEDPAGINHQRCWEELYDPLPVFRYVMRHRINFLWLLSQITPISVAREDSWESLGLQGDPNQSILKEINPEYSLERTYTEAEAPVLWAPDAKNWLIRKEPDAGKD